MSRVIGIDLGTTNSCVAILEDGQPVVIPNTGRVVYAGGVGGAGADLITQHLGVH